MQNRGWSRHSLLSAPKQSGNTRATCRGVVDEAFADPVVHTRIAGKFLLDVFGGSGFGAKTTIIWVCVAMCSTRSLVHDVTQPLVLATIRQDVSARKCVAGLISPPREHTSCSSKVISVGASIAKLASTCSHPLDSGTPSPRCRVKDYSVASRKWLRNPRLHPRRVPKQCMVEKWKHESTRQRPGITILVHEFIPIPLAMKIPDEKTAVDKAWKKLETTPAWNFEKSLEQKEDNSGSTKSQKRKSTLPH